MRLPFRAGLLAAVLICLVPSAALADQTVPPGGSIQTAVNNAPAGGEVITIQGAHTEDVTVDKPITFVGVDGAGVTGTFSVSSAGVKFRTLALGSTSGSVVTTTGDGGAALTGLLLQRIGAAGTTPAISGAGAGGVQLTDVIAVNTGGPVLELSGSDANGIVRSTVASTEASGAGSDAVRMLAGATKLVSDSSILIGGASAAGLRVVNQASGLAAPAAISVALRHATLTGAKQGIVLDATRPVAQQSGPISATVTSSIVHEPSSAMGAPAGPAPFNVPAESRVALAFDRSDTPGVADADKNAQADVSNTAGQFTADVNQLFGKFLRLRIGSPAIDRGGAPAADESATDVDAQPRSNGPASDIGADEFVNRPPKAALTASNAAPAQNEPVTFTSTSTDPDVDLGDSLTQYYWTFGDGSQAITDVPTVSHAFATLGDKQVRLAVKDRNEAFSEIVSTTVTVKDGTAPVVSITTPKANAKLKLNPKAKKAKKGKKGKKKKAVKPKPLPLTVLGTVADPSGVRAVEVALTYRRTATAKSCRQYTGKALKSAGCTDFTFVKARLVGDGWQLVTKKGVRLPKGRYELRARGTDANGITGGPIFSGADRSLVRFSVR